MGFGAAADNDVVSDVEVYANGVAFDVVKGWLGEEGKDLDWSAWYGAEDVDGDKASRPERLGLGAKFLPHKKAVQLMGGVQKKLGKSIMQSRHRREEKEDDDDADDEDARRGRGGRNGGVAGSKRQAQWEGGGACRKGGGGGGGGGRFSSPTATLEEDEDGDSDGDGGGRAAAFAGESSKRKAASTPAWDPRTDAKCVGGASGQQGSKKKRKKEQ